MNDQLRLDRQRPTHARYVMLGWLASMCFIAYAQRSCISVFYGQMQDDLQLSKYQLSWMQSAFFWSYALLQIPGAWMAERWGVRRMLVIDALFWSISTAFTGMSTGLTALIVTRLGVGVGQAGAFPAGMLAISRWFPVAQRGLPSGVMTSFMLIGGAAGIAGAARLLDDFSWRQILWLFSLLGVVWSAGFYFWFRETPREHSWVNEAELQEIGNPVAPVAQGSAVAVDVQNPWAIILASPSAWLVFAQHFVRAIWTGFLVTKFSEYLAGAFAVSGTRAGYFASGIVLIGVLGNWLGGILADFVIRRTGSLQLGRQGLAVAMMLLAGVTVIVPAFVENIWIAAFFLGLSNILAGVGGPAAYAVTIDIGGRHVSKVFACMNMIGNFGSAVAPPLIVAFVDWRDGAWASLPLMFGGVYVVAALCWIGIKTRSLFDPPAPVGPVV